MKYPVANEDLRTWFRQKWVRMDTKGNIKGDCAREEGEGKPKCLPSAQAHSMSKEDRAAAARRKRRQDPVADRPGKGGKPINVRTEEMDLEEANKPTNPALWSRAKSLAKSKFDVYPSAYANGWAAKWYKSKGGGWKSVSEGVDDEGGMAKGELETIAGKAKSLSKMMKKNKQLDAWVQSKITKADDYIGSVHDYLKNGKQEVDEQMQKKSFFKLREQLDSICIDCDDSAYGSVEEDFEPTGDEQYEDWDLEEAQTPLQFILKNPGKEYPPFDPDPPKKNKPAGDEAKHGGMSRAKHLAQMMKNKMNKMDEDLEEAKDTDKYTYIDQSKGQIIKGKSGTYVGYTHSATKGKGANILKHNQTKKYYAAGGSSTAFTQKTTLHDTPEDAARAYHKGNLAEASPMIKPPKNEFGKKEDAFAHAKKHGGKVMKKTFTHPTSGMKTVSYVVKEEAELDEASLPELIQMLREGISYSYGFVPGRKKPNATTRHLRDYPVSDKDVAKPVKKPEKKKEEKQGVAEGSVDELFEPQTDYYKTSKGKMIQATYRTLPNQNAVPGTVKVSDVHPHLKPQGSSFDSDAVIRRWDDSPDGVKQAIMKHVSKPKKSVNTVTTAESLELQEAEKNGKNVQLNKPFRTSDGKGKFAVYTKNEKGNVVKVNFGDTTGLTIKTSNPDRRRNFRARHNCDNPGPRHKARYWACKSWSKDTVSAGLGTK